MEYIPVSGLAPNSPMQTPLTIHFNSYLSTIAEPTTSRNWSLNDVYRHVQKIYKRKVTNSSIYYDSGGFQIITGHIKENRIREFTDIYHFILENFREEIDYIFSLDINTPTFNKEKIFKYNDYSIDSSIALIEKYPELRDKQLFVVQSRFPHILKDWLELMDKHQVVNYYDRFSLGGLVGLKKETRSQFNHFIPTSIWLLTYIKNRRQMHTPFPKQVKQIHMLGQSSRVAIISATILEKIFDVNITMDSSEILRFSHISTKVPLIYKTPSKGNFRVVGNLIEMQDMLDINSLDYDADKLEQVKKDLEKGKISNPLFIEVLCQNLSNLTAFAKSLVDDIPAEEIIQWEAKDFEEYHDIFKIGRLSTEVANNMRLIRTLKPYYDDNNFIGINDHVMKLIANYYSDKPSRTGEL